MRPPMASPPLPAVTVVEPKRPASAAGPPPASRVRQRRYRLRATRAAGAAGATAGIGTTRLAAEGTHLVGQLLDLRGEGAQLGFEAIDAHAVGAAPVAGATTGGGAAATATARQRFERADHDLHVDELLLELLDALLQTGIVVPPDGRRSLRLRLRLRGSACASCTGLGGGRRRSEHARQAGAADDREKGAMHEQWTT